MSRKRRAATIADDVGVSCSSSAPDEEKEASDSDASFGISSALTRRKPLSRKGKAPLIPHDDGTDNDTELEEMIRNSISKRNVKDGTELLKNTKGKKKLSKGELGGGSFQSMGTSSCSPPASHNLIWVFFRAFPMDFTLPDATGFPYAYSNPARLHPSSSLQPSS
jgi:hypothetical protein